MKDSLKRIVGEHAINNDFKVEDDFAKLLKSLDYLNSQLNYIKDFIKNDMDKNEIINYIDDIKKNTITILK